MAYDALSLTGKTCIVTGGTSGIGRAIALGLAQAGANVIAGSTSDAKVSATRDALHHVGPGKHDARTIDVANPQSVQQAIDHAVQTFGRLDGVVNAAGIIKKEPSLDVSVEDFERIVRVNLTGNFIVAQAAGRVMKDQSPGYRGVRGAIVNIASLNSYVSFSQVLSYACSKCGVMGLTRGLANEWAQYGIRVNGIAPGVFPTDLNRPIISGTPRGEWLRHHTPLDRFGEADEIAGAAIYLLSDAASFTTGETIAIDGGFLARGVGL